MLEMTPGAPTSPWVDTRWFDSAVSADATTTGIFTPVATSGRMVRKGEVLGTVRDYAGRQLEKVRAPTDGYVMYGMAGPPVKAGDPVATIALPARAPL